MAHPPHVHVVKRKLADGSIREYLYDRRTRRRLDPETYEPDAPAKAKDALYETGTLGALCAAYRKSPDYKAKAPATRQTYQQAMDHLADYARLPVAGLKRKHVLGIRDRLLEERGPGAAHHVLVMLSVLSEFGIDREMLDFNPVRGVRKPKLGEYEPWDDAALAAAWTGLTGSAFAAFVVGLYTGQRIGDVAGMRWSDYDGTGVRVVQEKTGERLFIPAHATLRRYLDAWKAETNSLYIVHRPEDGTPYTGVQLSRHFSQRKRKLGTIHQPYHGLRKRATEVLAEAGCTDRQIMSITGHRTAAMVTKYSRAADQRVQATAAITKVEEYEARKRQETAL